MSQSDKNKKVHLRDRWADRCSQVEKQVGKSNSDKTNEHSCKGAEIIHQTKEAKHTCLQKDVACLKLLYSHWKFYTSTFTSDR